MNGVLIGIINVTTFISQFDIVNTNNIVIQTLLFILLIFNDVFEL